MNVQAAFEWMILAGEVMCLRRMNAGNIVWDDIQTKVQAAFLSSKKAACTLSFAYFLFAYASGRKAAASLASRVTVSQSRFATTSLGVSHVPPTHRTLGSAR